MSNLFSSEVEYPGEGGCYVRYGELTEENKAELWCFFRPQEESVPIEVQDIEGFLNVKGSFMVFEFQGEHEAVCESVAKLLPEGSASGIILWMEYWGEAELDDCITVVEAVQAASKADAEIVLGMNVEKSLRPRSILLRVLLRV